MSFVCSGDGHKLIRGYFEAYILHPVRCLSFYLSRCELGQQNPTGSADVAPSLAPASPTAGRELTVWVWSFWRFGAAAGFIP